MTLRRAILFATDDQVAFAQVGVRGNFQVGRGWLVLEYPASKVEGRAMAGAEEAARPILAKIRVTDVESVLIRLAHTVKIDAIFQTESGVPPGFQESADDRSTEYDASLARKWGSCLVGVLTG